MAIRVPSHELINNFVKVPMISIQYLRTTSGVQWTALNYAHKELEPTKDRTRCTRNGLMIIIFRVCLFLHRMEQFQFVATMFLVALTVPKIARWCTIYNKLEKMFKLYGVKQTFDHAFAKLERPFLINPQNNLVCLFFYWEGILSLFTGSSYIVVRSSSNF